MQGYNIDSLGRVIAESSDDSDSASSSGSDSDSDSEPAPDKGSEDNIIIFKQIQATNFTNSNEMDQLGLKLITN